MPYKVVKGELISTPADIIVRSMTSHGYGTSNEEDGSFFSAAGASVEDELKLCGCVFTSRLAITSSGNLPCRYIFHAVPPRYLTGKSREFDVLRMTYRNIISEAERLGCKTIAMPFLSTCYFRFPWDYAINIALSLAAASGLDITFVTDDEELFKKAVNPTARPKIVSYIGYFRDYAVFLLEDGMFAMVDLRIENRDVMVVPYCEPCYVDGNNPLQPPLSESEKIRVSKIYEEYGW